MRKVQLLLFTAGFVAAAGLAPPSESYATETPKGAIVSTNASSKNNANTSSTFALPSATPGARRKFTVQCDVPTYVTSNCTSSSCTATSSDTRVEAGQNFPLELQPGDTHIATLCVLSGSCTCQVRFVKP